MQITVAQVSKDGVRTQQLTLEEGATVAQALKASGLVPGKTARLAVHNVFVQEQTLLKDKDRVEILPPLIVEPMKARRLREAKNQGVKRDLTMGRNGGKHRLFK